MLCQVEKKVLVILTADLEGLFIIGDRFNIEALLPQLHSTLIKKMRVLQPLLFSCLSFFPSLLLFAPGNRAKK